MQNPLVSVIITSYNHEKYIRQAIESCLMQQTSFPYEIIIHDDASTDNSAKIIRGFADKYPDLIIPILQEENQYSKGVRITATILVPRARGTYLAICEGDDYWIDPLKLEKQIAIMENDPSISLCFTATKWVYVNGSKKAKIARYAKKDRYFTANDVIMRSGAFTDLVSTVVRKEVYESIPDWYYLSPNGDQALYLLSILSGRSYYQDEVTAVYHRGVENSWSTRNSQIEDPKYFENKISLLEAFNEYTDCEFQETIHRRNFLEIMAMSFIYTDMKEFREKYYQRFSSFQRIEYFFFHKLIYVNRYLAWRGYHKILRLIGFW